MPFHWFKLRIQFENSKEFGLYFIFLGRTKEVIYHRIQSYNSMKIDSKVATIWSVIFALLIFYLSSVLSYSSHELDLKTPQGERFTYITVQTMFWSWKGMVISPTRVNSCLFWVWLAYLLLFLFVLSFIYLLIVICDNFALGRSFDFVYAHFLHNGALYFSLKNLLCGKSFLK